MPDAGYGTDMSNGAGTDMRGLAAYLTAQAIHPVFVFGTRGAGKTMFLLSLIAYTRQVAELGIDVSLGDMPTPADLHNARDRHENAVKIYQQGVGAFMAGEKAPRTQTELPFFIPINLRVDRDGRIKTYKLAFLEGMGEWYEREETVIAGATPYRFRDFPGEVAGLLEAFTAPVSVIFVAPGEGDGRLDNRDHSHRCLANCMETYARCRRGLARRDNLLLLVTKWDAVYSPTDPDGHFGDATADDIVKIISEWPEIWAKFSGLTGLHKDAKGLMPYAAAWMNRNHQIIPPGPDHRNTFLRFNRTVWNWLYGNLTQSEGMEDDSKRKILFPDVSPVDLQKAGTLARLTRALLWV